MKHLPTIIILLMMLDLIWFDRVLASDLFPEIPGWTITRDEKIYNSENLWDLIDGAADAFFLYGFIDLHLAEYRDTSGIEVRVEIYRHSSPNNTFGIYALERKPDYHFIPIGIQGYAEAGVLNFLVGEYYIKLSSHRTDVPVSRALELIARNIDRHLLGSREWPSELRLLPDEGKIPNSEGYVSEGYLGYSILRSAFTAQYGKTSPFELFIIEKGNDAEAAKLLNDFLGAIKGRIISKQNGIHHIDEQNLGRLTVVSKGKYVGGLVRCGDLKKEGDYIKLLLKQLQ
jgi:hypothetical protein